MAESKSEEHDPLDDFPPELRDDEPTDSDYPLMLLPNNKWLSFRPPHGGEFGINFGSFIVICTGDGAAIVLPKHLRVAMAQGMVDAITNGGTPVDRLLCHWPGVDDTSAEKLMEMRERLLKSSLRWIPKEDVP